MALPTLEELEWMEAHINDSLVPDVIACCTISSVFATLAVALRMWSRFQNSPKPVVSDWLTVVGLVGVDDSLSFMVQLTPAVAAILHRLHHCFRFLDTVWRWEDDDFDQRPARHVHAVHCTYSPTLFTSVDGLGLHRLWCHVEQDTDKIMQLNILNVILYGIATAFVKGIILALYHPIFPLTGFRIYVWVLGNINVLGAIVIVLVTVLQCQPLEKLWDPMMQGGHCIDFSNFSLFNVVYNQLCSRHSHPPGASAVG